MTYCAKCGSEVSEEMSFCPKCGAALKLEQPAVERPMERRRDEKGEKGEKAEKSEKREKHEKGEYAFIGPLVGGLILFFVGLTLYLWTQGAYKDWGRLIWAFFFVIIGIIIIVAAVYGAILAGRRHPRT